MTRDDNKTFALTVRKEFFHELAVKASNLDDAMAIAEERWKTGNLGEPQCGYTVLIDDESGEDWTLEDWRCSSRPS